MASLYSVIVDAFEQHKESRNFNAEPLHALTKKLMEISHGEIEVETSIIQTALLNLFQSFRKSQMSTSRVVSTGQADKNNSAQGGLLRVTATEFRPQSTSLQAKSAPLISEAEAFVNVLQHEFPQYSAAALEDIFLRCGQNLPATIDMMYSLEHELLGQLQTLHIGSKEKCREVQGQKDFSLSQEEFPSLKSQTGGSTMTMTKSAANAASIAPSITVSNLPTRSNDSREMKKPVTGSRPVWESPTGVVPKFNTGEAVAAEYAEARSLARDHARLRNACFQQATQAYMAGNKALAKELGAKGRWHNEQMKAAHEKAAMETFSKRNNPYLRHGAGASTSSTSSTSSIPTIDLHGLHVSEALLHLERTLAKLQSQHNVQRCRIVVGIGQHSKVPSRLPSAVRDTLTSWGFGYSEPYQGVLEVKLH